MHSGNSHGHDDQQCSEKPTGIRGGFEGMGRWFWSLLVRNRIALAIASLIWLVWRSGTKPSRLGYPCQQAAAANLGFLAVLFIPGLSKLRQRRAGSVRARAFAMATGSVCLAGVMFVLVSGGVAVWSNSAGDGGVASVAGPVNEGTGVDATVGMVCDPDWADDATFEKMVRKVVALAGGLEQVITDSRGGGDAPYFDQPDGLKTVIIIPNMTGTQPGLNTDHRITEILVEMAWEAGADTVTVGGAATGDNLQAFVDQGYAYNTANLFLKTDPTVPLLDLNDTGTTPTQYSNWEYGTENVQLIPLPLPTSASGTGEPAGRTSYYVHNALLQTDAMIVIPTLKNHGLGTLTLGLKMRIGTAPQDIYYATHAGSPVPFLRWQMHNYGQVPGNPQRFPFNANSYPYATTGLNPTSEAESVQRSLVDLNLVRPHDFVVIDGRVGCDQGPLVYNEPPSRPNILLASTDTVAIDAVASCAMGYNPDKIPSLVMANDSQVLGVMDRRAITVKGDRVAQVRVDFTDHPDWNSYAQAERSESVSPWMTAVSITEGGALVAQEESTVNVTGSGDNIGIVRAELALERIQGDNLLINGDFELGSNTGENAYWKYYWSDWGGMSGYPIFNDTVAGREGDYALHLTIPAGQDDSFAVYQEVAVEPGKAYRIDALWKANYYGHDSWYEVILLDGPWDPWEADQGGDDVLLNHMFSYDTNDTINCGAGNPMTADFDWIWTRDQIDEPVDNCWNDRDGIRVASGNVMTVVLKAGSCCGTNQADVWFDNVVLSEVQKEEVVAVTTDPTEDFSLVFDARQMAQDKYMARVSVYDAALNEATMSRDVIDLIAVPSPLINVFPKTLEQTIFVGDACSDELISIQNAGIDTLNYMVNPSESWLWADPDNGVAQESAIANDHAVNFDCESLAPGDHTAKLVVDDPGAFNTGQEVIVTIHVETVASDIDRDGDVDQSDFGILQACMTATNDVLSPGDPCSIADLDGDTFVDMEDRDFLMQCNQGANVFPDPACE